MKILESLIHYGFIAMLVIYRERGSRRVRVMPGSESNILERDRISNTLDLLSSGVSIGFGCRTCFAATFLRHFMENLRVFPDFQ